MALHTSGGAGLAREAAAVGTILHRRSESGGTYFRSSRYYSVGHEWFAMTREGGQVGPFSDRGEAELGLAWHLALGLESQSGGEQPRDAGLQRAMTPLEVQLDEFLLCRREATTRGVAAACAAARERLDAIEDAVAGDEKALLKAAAIHFFLEEVDL